MFLGSLFSAQELHSSIDVARDFFKTSREGGTAGAAAAGAKLAAAFLTPTTDTALQVCQISVGGWVFVFACVLYFVCVSECMFVWVD